MQLSLETVWQKSISGTPGNPYSTLTWFFLFCDHCCILGRGYFTYRQKNCSNCLFIKSQRNIGYFSEKPHQWWFTMCSHSSFLGFWKKLNYCSIPCSTCSLSSDCHFLLSTKKMLQEKQNTNSLNNHQSILWHTTTLVNTESLVINNLGHRAPSHCKIIIF